MWCHSWGGGQVVHTMFLVQPRYTDLYLCYSTFIFAIVIKVLFHLFIYPSPPSCWVLVINVRRLLCWFVFPSQVIMLMCVPITGYHAELWSHLRLACWNLIPYQVCMLICDPISGYHAELWSHLRFACWIVIPSQVCILNCDPISG